MDENEKYNEKRPVWLLPTPERLDEPPTEGLRGLLLNLMQGRNLNRHEAGFLLSKLLEGEATDAQISAALVALAIKGETVEELAGMAEAMRSHSVKINSKPRRFH